MWSYILKTAKNNNLNKIVKKGKDVSKMNKQTKQENKQVKPLTEKPLTEKPLTEKPKYNDMPLL